MHVHVGRRARAGLLALALIIAPAISGCGQFKKGFDEGYNKSWAKKTHDDCVQTAQTRGPVDVAERYCTCVVNQLMPLTPSQKMSLTPTSPEVTQAAATCNAQIQQQAG